jgi:hypothetical protein
MNSHKINQILKMRANSKFLRTQQDTVTAKKIVRDLKKSNKKSKRHVKVSHLKVENRSNTRMVRHLARKNQWKPGRSKVCPLANLINLKK